MSSLVEFLKERIDEDEAVARQWPDDPAHITGKTIDAHGHPIYAPRARVLAECRAKRAIIAAHPAVGDLYNDPNHYCRTCQWDSDCDMPIRPGREGAGTYPCPTLLALVEPYRSHDDFDFLGWGITE
jgi:hypothetical protein